MMQERPFGLRLQADRLDEADRPTVCVRHTVRANVQAGPKSAGVVGIIALRFQLRDFVVARSAT